jgi:helicase required for RNAi-mediated heterochromatin assembly 1
MNGGIGIYTKVRFTTITFSTRGLGFRVVFSLSKVGKKVRWEQSKRLLAGSLVALTPSNDMFRTKCIVATVGARPMDLITEDPPKLDLFFAQPEDINLDPTIEYTMIEERTSFFEAVRHVGVSLQKMASEKFPLGKHIVNVDTKIAPPKYITAQPHLNLSSEFKPVTNSKITYDNVDVLANFPNADVDTTLDGSQRAALSHIFKKCVALIQGPPGTGKTHVSVKALKLLTENMTDVDSPIVVACQTNHALDQLLRHASEFVENFIRLGGRSKDTGIVKQRTLYAVRQKERFKAPGGMQHAARMALNKIETDMTELLAPLEYGKDQLTKGFMDLDYYRKSGILTQKQCNVLAKGDDEWATSSSTQNKLPLAQWLDGCLVHNSRTYAPDQLGGIEFEEADLEFEQLKEIEAENVCQDDENGESSTRRCMHILTSPPQTLSHCLAMAYPSSWLSAGSPQTLEMTTSRRC